MKISYKLILPSVFLLVLLLTFVLFFSRQTIENALFYDQFIRTVKTSQSALLSEEQIHVEKTLPENPNAHSEVGMQLTPDNFTNPKLETSQAHFQRYIQEFKDPVVLCVAIWDSNFNIVASSNSELTGQSAPDNLNLTKIFSDKTPYYLDNASIFKSDVKDSKGYIDVLAPIILDGKMYGVAEIQLDTQRILSPVQRQLDNIAWLLLVAGLLALLGIIFISEYIISKPIRFLQTEADRIGSGDLDHEIVVKSQDEIGSLAKFFESMRQRLAASVGSLKEFNRQLEIKVKERTVELRSEEARLLASLESLSLGFVIFDSEGQTLHANTALHTLLGQKSLTSIHDIAEQFGEAVDVVAIFTGITQDKKSADFQKFSFGEKSLRLFGAPILLGEEKQMIGVAMLIEDITKQEEIEKAKSDFVIMASHQLRTPITIMKWNIDLIKKKVAENPDKAEMSHVEAIEEGVERTNQLVESLLDISKIDAGNLMLNPKPVVLPTFVHDVLTQLEKEISHKQLQISEKYEDGLPSVMLDLNLFRTVLQNLLTNSIKYTPEGGSIEVEAKYMGGLEVSDNGEPSAVISVTDTGVGIPAKDQSKIFTKLYRADNVKLLQAGGTGLGLYATKAIVEMMGGKIWFKSEENKGTTFYVSVPIAGTAKKEGEVLQQKKNFDDILKSSA